jgi:hypothetical protein
VLAPYLGQLRVLEDAGLAAESDEMLEARRRNPPRTDRRGPGQPNQLAGQLEVACPDAFPGEPLSLAARGRGGASGEHLVGQQAAQRVRDRRRVLVRDEEPCTACKQLVGVGEPGRNNRFARGERLHQHPGDDLLARVVRQQDDVGPADLPQQRGGVPVGVVELDPVGDAERRRARAERLAVALAMELAHLGMRLSGDDVVRRPVEVGEPGDRVDAPLDPLARAEKAPGENDRRGAVRASGLGEVGTGPVRDGLHLLCGDRVLLEQPRPCGRALDDQTVGEAPELLHDPALSSGRLPEHGVQHDDRRGARVAKEIHHLVAVRPAVDAELVLHDRHVELLQRRDGFGPRPRGTAHELGDDILRVSVPRLLVDGGDDTDAARRHRGRHRVCERRRERRDPAPRRRIRAYQCHSRRPEHAQPRRHHTSFSSPPVRPCIPASSRTSHAEPRCGKTQC